MATRDIITIIMHKQQNNITSKLTIDIIRQIMYNGKRRNKRDNKTMRLKMGRTEGWIFYGHYQS
jgi:hypothetical protein